MKKALYLLTLLTLSISVASAQQVPVSQAMSSCPSGTQFIRELVKGAKETDVHLFNPDTTYKSVSTSTYAVFTLNLPIASNVSDYPKAFYMIFHGIPRSDSDVGWINKYYPNTKNEYAADEFEFVLSTSTACVFDGPSVVRKFTSAAGGSISIPIYPDNNFKQLNYDPNHLNAGTKYFLTVRGKADEVGKYKIRSRYDPSTNSVVKYSDKGGTYGLPSTEDGQNFYLMQKGAVFADDSSQSLPPSSTPKSSGVVNFSPTSLPLSLYSKDDANDKSVSNLQSFLKSTICPDIIVSGFFGAKTNACVKEYQKQRSLPSTGYVGQMTKAALSNDTGDGLKVISGGDTKAAIVGGGITQTYCGNSDLPISTVAGPSTSVSQVGWGGTASYVGPNLVAPSRAYLGKTFTVSANYQNEGLSIETNPLSTIPSNAINIKQTSATTFDVTVNDGKFITKGGAEAKLYIRAKSNYTPKKGEVYRDGCTFVTISPDNSSNNSNTTRTPILSLAGLTLPINGAVTLSVANLMPGASVPRLCVMGTNTAAYNDTCSKTKPSGVLFEVTPNNLNESVPYCQPQSSKVDGFGLATYHCTASTPGNIKVNAASTYRNPYNIWVYDQDVDVSPYDNSKTHYNKSNIVQLSIADSGNSSISDTCPAGQAMYVAYSSGSGPACTSCEFIPEATRSGIAKCSNVTDAPATWQTSTVSGSVDKGVLVSGFERYSQCPNGAPGSVGQTCSNKGYSCYMPSNSSSFTVYKCPGYTGATATLKGKAYSEDNTGKLTPVPAGYQIAAGLLIPGWSCSKVVTTASDGSYDFNGNAGCIIGLPNIALYAPSEILNGTGPGQTVFSNANSLASVRPTSYGNVPDLIYYKGTGSYTFANNPVIGNPDTSTCAYDSNQQDNMRLEKIFTQTPSKAAMGTPGTYNNKTYWYAGEPNGGFWQRSIGKCSDPVTTNPPSGPAARSLVAYVHKLSCSDMPSTNMSIFKQGLSAALQPEFYVGLGASQSVGNLVSKRVLAYYSSSPTWEIMPGFGIIISPSEYAQLIDSLPTVSRSDALKKCGM